MTDHLVGDGLVPLAMHKVGLASFDGTPIETFHTDLVAGRSTVVLALPFGLRHAAAQGFYARVSDRLNVVTWESRFVMNFDGQPDAQTITADMHAGDLVAVIDHYDLGPADVIGYCSGAGITLLAAAKHPERFRRLTLVSGEYMLSPAQCRQTSFQREVFVVLPAAAGSRADAAKLHEKLASASAKPTHEFHEFVSLPFSSPEHFYRFGLNYLAYRDLDMLDIAGSVGHDALLIATRHDAQVTVESAEMVAKHLPASRGVVVLDGDHYQLCRGDPNVVAELVAFLTSPSSVEPAVMTENTVDFHFERQVSRTPDALALVGSGERLTYRDLNARANRLGRLLAGRGVRPGDVVLLSLPRSADAVVAMIAIMKVGAVFSPIDPTYPAAVKRQFVRDSGARHAIVGRRGDIALSEAAVDCIDVGILATLDGDAGAPVGRTHDGQSPLYIMFTSGSTGTPKGVVTPHRGVVRLVLDTNYIQIDPADVVLQLSPITFDASTFEIWGALLNGARLVIHEAPGFDPNAVARLVADEKVTIMWLTSALFHLVVRSFIGLLSGLRVLLAGGDVLNPAAVRDVLKAFPEIVVINGYGPTENTTFTCCHVMTSATPPGDSVPIGRPITGTDVHVLDGDRREVGAGEAGELYAGGAGVALGYLNAPEATRNSFVTDPRFGPGVLYRTGDLVRRTSDGVVEFVGRIDSVVKIRGFRVSADEVRSLLITVPGIDDAIVQVNADAAGEKQLAAVVQVREPRADMTAFIRSELRKQAPAFMVPDSITVCDQLPVSANGKVDRKWFQRKPSLEGEKHA